MFNAPENIYVYVRVKLGTITRSSTPLPTNGKTTVVIDSIKHLPAEVTNTCHTIIAMFSVACVLKESMFSDDMHAYTVYT